MAKLRLFANLREIAGTGRVEIPASSVGEVIRLATEKFGPRFGEGLASAKVWLNGEEAGLEDEVGDNDEVVLLPPVSGGGQPITAGAIDLLTLLPLGVLVLAVLANLGSREAWVSSLVAIAAVWALDMGSAFMARGRIFAPLAVVTTSAVAALSAHILGGTGYGLTVALAVAVTLGWAVAFPDYRLVPVFSPTLLVSLLAGLATASLVLARTSFSPDDRAVDVFLVAMAIGVGVGALVSRLPPLPFIDPFSSSAIGTVLASVGAAALWDLDVVGYLLVGLGLAVALVAGRGLSAMLRTGRVSLTERPYGVLASVDGPVLAGAVFYPLIRLLL